MKKSPRERERYNKHTYLAVYVFHIVFIPFLNVNQIVRYQVNVKVKKTLFEKTEKLTLKEKSQHRKQKHSIHSIRDKREK